MLLVHGFPEFWWAWRHQLPALADAGYHAVAMDLRGYGGSDKTPRGYDPMTLSADLHGVIGALGASQATVVGHGWGATVGWTAAAQDSERGVAVRGLVSVATTHPLAAHRLASRATLARQLASMQPPLAPERRIIADHAAYVGAKLRAWSAPTSGFPDAEAEETYRTAMSVWPAPHCAAEYHRWAFRSRLRSDGRRFNRLLSRPVPGPVLQVLGAEDPLFRLGRTDPSRAFVDGSYECVVMEGSGHFPHEEVPQAFTAVLLDWLRRHVGGVAENRPRDEPGRG